jgi:dephospho-CoA kinase
MGRAIGVPGRWSLVTWPRTTLRRIGLTGGIAAGKSVVVARLDELGVAVVDHDRLARDIVAPGSEGLARVDEEFPGVVHDGTLDRAALGAIVFADPEARARLEAVTHPRIHQAALDAEQVLESQGTDVVVHDVPLLVETGQSGFDLIVLVEAPELLRVERLVRTRGLTREQALARISAQADDETRRKVADVVLDGSGSTAHLRQQVDDLVTGWNEAAGPR